MYKNFVLPAVAAALLLAAAGPANAAVKVFACEPEWAALAREIGGDRVTAYTATHARQDPQCAHEE